MSTIRSILIVVNPTSGRGRGARTTRALTEQLRAAGVTVTVRETQRTGDAEAISRETVAADDRPDCIVACGGDGTIQEVANALAATGGGSTMGLAPAGRCNDFARVLGISKDPTKIVEVLTGGEVRRIDLGRVNGRFFCTVVTIGVDAEVSQFVDTMRMPLAGTAAYLYGAFRVLLTYRPRTLRITGDFGVIHRPVFLASSANTSSYGGAIPIVPGASPVDGQLDVCVIDHVSWWRMLTLVPAVLRGRHRGAPEVRFLKARKFEIDATETLTLWADGERIAQTPATIEVVPGALKLMTPRDLACDGQATEGPRD